VLLLENDADVMNARYYRKTSLFIAAEQNHANVCELLLNSGADAEAADKEDRTALITAPD
jgi:ankyrin repeat protein